MTKVGSIEAVLTLNSTGFTEGLSASTTALNKFATATAELNNANSSKAIRSLDDALHQLESSLLVVDGLNKKSISTFSKLSNAVNNMAKGLRILQSDTLNVDQAVNTMNNIFKAFQGALSGTEIKVKGVSTVIKELSNTERQSASTTNQVAVATQQYDKAIELALPPTRNLITGTRELASSQNQLQAEERETASATDRASNSMNRQASASKGLGKALSSLKMMGTMVGSMIAYNFVHNLAMATSETINAKSEMNGYLQMLGSGKSQVNDFNKALDETVQKFPRLNKYALGETVSSIGVEFELTTKEMKKAMPVVSMITSEYLRAGRNVNEASLAVKDILQGEFQRLSRETGVKGDQLKEAGWSGDNTDVMGLLEALDKVGKQRNWDKFVAKANSLNDAVLITQNRFSEWSADMVERVQPAILGVFNDLMIVGSDFAKVFNEILDWLSGDGLGQSIVKWGGLATAIGGVATALAVYRTGANLTQIAQMGLTKTIGATIFGLEAESVAQYGLRTSLIANITHMEAEEVARKGRLNSIIATITGLEAEEVAEMGKAKALASSILGLDMATVKEYGFTTALWSSITGVEAETIALEGWNAQMYISVAVTGAVAGALAVLTGALILQAIKISNTTEKYAKFVNMLDKGDDVINEAKDSVDSLTSKKEKLEEKLATLEEGTYKYDVTANKLKVTTDDLTMATQNYSDAVNSVAWVKHKQELYDKEKASAQADAQKEINQALLDYGMNVKDAQELSSQYWNDAINGWNQHYETLQKVNLQYSKNATSVQGALKELENTKLSDKEVTVLIRRKITTGNAIADAKEELGNATSLTEYLDKWLWLQVRQIQNALADWDINNASGGISQAIGGVVWGIVHFFGDNFIGQFTQSLARDWGLEGIGTKLYNKIVKEGLLKTISDFFHMDGFQKDLDDIIKAGVSNIDVIGLILNAILPAPASASDGGSSDHPSFMEDLSAILGFDVQTWVTNFNSDPLGTLGIQLPQLDILGLITSLIPSGGEGGFDFGGWLNSVFDISGLVVSFTTSIQGIVTTATDIYSTVSGIFGNLKSAIFNHITNLVNNVQTGFENAKSYAVSKITAMRDSVSGVIHQMTDAWVRMKDSILNSAKLIYDGVKEKFDSVKNTLKDFFGKLQDPSKWGAGQKSWSRTPKPHTARKIFSNVAQPSRRSGAGINPYSSPNQKVKLQDLVQAVGGSQQVTLSDFLALFSEGGFGSWSFHEPAKKKVFDTGKKWKSGSPVIKGIGSVGSGYEVSRFWDGKPRFAWQEFMAIAESIFSKIPYKFYYDSEWKGSWLGALLSGALNCSDGAEALIALASVFGFGGGIKVHTTTKDGTGHFYARINGHNLDTTHFQNSGSWSPLGGAGTGGGRVSNKTVNVNVEISGTVYGVDDLDSKIQESVQAGLQAEFNDPYTVTIF